MVSRAVAKANGQQRQLQRSFVFKTWGGRRKGAGRKQTKARKSEPHRARPEIRPGYAVHVTLRVADDLSRLRRRDAFRAVRKAMLVVLGRADFRIVHASVQANHIHLLCEAESKHALARGLQAFQISAARRLNRAEAKQRGRVRRAPAFPDRYQATIITTPRHARHCLAYVLNNWRRHKEDRAGYARTWSIDPYSTAVAFRGWHQGVQTPDATVHELFADDERLPTATPQSWLLREGWSRFGALSVFEVPGQRL